VYDFQLQYTDSASWMHNTDMWDVHYTFGWYNEHQTVAVVFQAAKGQGASGSGAIKLMSDTKGLPGYNLWGNTSGDKSGGQKCVSQSGLLAAPYNTANAICSVVCPGCEVLTFPLYPMSNLTPGTYGKAGFDAYDNPAYGWWANVTIQVYYYGQVEDCTPVLYDNGMEQYPNSSYWSPYTHVDDTHRFARLYEGNLLHRIWYGDAYCGTHHHLTGVWDRTFPMGNVISAVPISQSFCWPGGTFYWGAVAKRKAGTGVLGCGTMDAEARMELSGPNLTSPLIYKVPVETDWTAFSRSYTYLPRGTYTMTLDMEWDVTGHCGEGYTIDQMYSTKPWVSWDNVRIGQVPVLPEVCYDEPDPITGTVTPSATPVQSPTPTCQPYVMGAACGFNNGANDGWQTIDGNSGPFRHSIFGDVYFISYVDRPIPPGQYMGHWPGAVYYIGEFQPCGDGRMYLDFYAWGLWRLRVRDTRSGQIVADFNGGTTVQWDLHHYRYRLNIPAGSYEIIASALIDSGVFIDSFAVGAGVGVACDSPASTTTPGPSPTPTASRTPTNTPTSGGPTATATITPNRPTSTATATRTPIPSFTPFITWTPRPPTATPLPTPTPTPSRTPYYSPTDTPWPTHTVLPGTDTPTLPPTYTPPATYTPEASSTPLDPTPTWPANEPPQQPPPSCYSTCIRPTWGSTPRYDHSGSVIGAISNLWYSVRNFGTNATNYVSGWMDYTRCNGLSFIVWCPEHTESMAAIPTEFALREPFGTVNEIQQSLDAVATVYSQYNWANTGIKINGTPMAINESPNLEMFQASSGSNPYNGGRIDITGQHPSITGESSTTCEMEISTWVGPNLTQGMCFAFTTLHRLGVLGWMQFTVNLCAIILLIMYIMRRWVNASTGSG
jgi:hypothetical protein